MLDFEYLVVLTVACCEFFIFEDFGDGKMFLEWCIPQQSLVVLFIAGLVTLIVFLWKEKQSFHTIYFFTVK